MGFKMESPTSYRSHIKRAGSKGMRLTLNELHYKCTALTPSRRPPFLFLPHMPGKYIPLTVTWFVTCLGSRYVPGSLCAFNKH